MEKRAQTRCAAISASASNKVPILQAAMGGNEKCLLQLWHQILSIFGHIRPWLPEMTANLLGINACITVLPPISFFLLRQTQILLEAATLRLSQ
jgi:hypothetical protein